MSSASLSAIAISAQRPDSPEATQLLAELDADLWRQPYPPESRHAFSVEKLLRERVAFFVVRYRDQPAACGGVKIFDEEYGEIKRMYVRPAVRGLGLGRTMLNYLAKYAITRSVPVLRLETGIYQIDAIRLYERFGFQRRAPFGEYREDPMSVYFEKSLTVNDEA